MTRRLALYAGLALAVAVGVTLRISTRRAHLSGGRVRTFGSDDDYHLRRARFAAAHFPRTILFDPLMNAPSGGVPIWPPLFDLALAAPARLVHGAGASPASVERGAAWVPVAFGAAAIALAGLLGAELFGTAGAIAVALFVALSPGHLLWTQFAHTDQHAAESATGLLVLYLFLRSRDRSPTDLSLRGSSGREAAAGAALALAVLTWQGAIYWAAIIASALFAESALHRRPILRAVGWTLAAPAAVVGVATAAWLGPIRPPVTYVSFGLFQPLFLAALAAGTLLLETLLLLARRELPRRQLGLRLLLLATLGALLFPVVPDLAGGLARGVGYVLGKTEEAAGSGGYVSYPRAWLKGIYEARPLLADGPGLALAQLSGSLFLSPAVIALWVFRARRGPRPATHTTLAIWGVVTLFLAFSQRLNVYYAAPLAGVCLVEAVRFLAARLSRGGRVRPRVALAGAAAAGLLLVLPMIAGIRKELATVRVPGSDLYDTLDWMDRSLPKAIDPYDPRLLLSPPPPEATRAAAVLAPWSLGHMILYHAGQPVVANNFGYGFLDSVRFFLAQTEGEALALAARRNVRWVLATDLVPRMNDYALYLGRPPYLRGTARGLEPAPAYFSTLQSRLYDFDGKGLAAAGVPPLTRFRLLHHSASAILRGGRWVARWKVYEIVGK